MFLVVNVCVKFGSVYVCVFVCVKIDSYVGLNLLKKFFIWSNE